MVLIQPFCHIHFKLCNKLISLKKSGGDVSFGLRKANKYYIGCLQYNNDLTGPEYKVGVLDGDKILSPK